MPGPREVPSAMRHQLANLNVDALEVNYERWIPTRNGHAMTAKSDYAQIGRVNTDKRLGVCTGVLRLVEQVSWAASKKEHAKGQLNHKL